jgi:hypothetical protein
MIERKLSTRTKLEGLEDNSIRSLTRTGYAYYLMIPWINRICVSRKKGWLASSSAAGEEQLLQELEDSSPSHQYHHHRHASNTVRKFE